MSYAQLRKRIILEIPFNNLNMKHNKYKSEFLEIFLSNLTTGDFVLGQNVDIFEENFREFVNAKYAIGVANGSDALRISILVKNFQTGSSISLAANTYFAAAASIIHAGHKPVFFDVQLDTRFPSAKDIESTLSEDTVAVIRSHLFGDADTIELNTLTEIHDCSQAHGTLVNGKHVGSGKLSTFSFYPGKNLGALGDAGIITTDSEEEYRLVKAMHNQGTIKDRYVHEYIGFNSRLDSIQAGILIFKLKKLIEENNERKKIAERYMENLSNQSSSIKLFSTRQQITSTYHLFQVYIESEDLNHIQGKLQKYGVSTGRHYPTPLHLQPAFRKLGYAKGDFPNSEKLAKHSLSLPIFPEMLDAEVDYVCEQLIRVVNL